MPDVITAPSAEQTPAASSPAPVNHQEVLNNLSPEARKEWRLTGKIPEPKKAEDSATSDPSDAEKAESAPAPEAGKTQDRAPKRDNAESRLKELLADLKTAGLSPAELKTFKREAQKAETKAEPSPAPQKVEAPQKLEAPKKPDIKDFDDYQKYEDARDKYYEDLADFKKKEAIAEIQQRQLEAARNQILSQQLKDGRERYKDFDDVALPVLKPLFDDKDIPPLVKEIAGGSPVFTHLLYVIGGDTAQRDQLLADAKQNPIAAIKKLAVLENLVMEELSKPSKDEARNDKGQFLSAPEKKITNAPKPPAEVGGTAAAPGDKVQESVQKRDFAAYRAEMNRRDLAARKSS